MSSCTPGLYTFYGIITQLTKSVNRSKMAAPIVMVVSSSTNICCSDLIKAIRKEDELPTCEESLNPNICGYPWHISNKYYTANVLLCHPKEKSNPAKYIPPEIEAIISIIDDKKYSFDEAKQYWKKIEDLEPATRIIVCHGFTKAGDLRRREIIEWCIDSSFELVELNRSEFDEEEEEDDEFQEPYGSGRINQALNAHNWPNLEMKDRDEREIARQLQAKLGLKDEDEERSPRDAGYKLLPDSDDSSDQVAAAELSPSQEAATGQDKGGGTTEGGTNSLDADGISEEDAALFRALGNEDPGSESFEELFMKMASMKEKANSLPPEERKKYAEKVVVSFWKAIGGDEDEIDGLSDDD
ncbi:Alpha- and gamma-adaptin-binding protein p34 [Holothuria leucospilota]|uniref:Alpha- and gamma-adaptin-binding protein p34 n=1 Tax=Holothuria leucospilota TaxID=206669 RepID=A0A9Q1BMI3_HOLLE|nr:Alpha- and gamma-adaptin-binding protein p34 [Holothuria leucospilota]